MRYLIAVVVLAVLLSGCGSRMLSGFLDDVEYLNQKSGQALEDYQAGQRARLAQK